MQDGSHPRTLADYARVLRRHLWLIAVMAVIAAGAAIALTANQSKSYTATATLNFVDPSEQAGQVGGLPSTTPQGTVTAAGVARLTQHSTLQEVKSKLHTPLSIDQLKNDISTSVNPTSFLVTVTATSSSPTFAAQLANAVVYQTKYDGDQQARAAYASLAGQIQHQYNSLTPAQRQDQLTTSALIQKASTAQALARAANTVQIASTAQTPSSPSSSSPAVNGVLGAVLGIVLGLVLAAVRESFDRRLRGPGDIEGELGLPYLGQVREHALGKIRQDGNASLLDGADFEAFRILRTNLDFLVDGNPPRTLLVSSALPEEGKTTVALSLAYTSAVAGRRTLLVECDLRRPALSNRLGIPRSPGLTDYLTEKAEPAQVVRPVDIGTGSNGASPNGHQPVSGAPLGRLVCIPAGSSTDQPAELLGSQRFKEFLQQVSQVYDLVVLDASPLLPVADTLELLTSVEAMLVCVRASRTTRDQVRAAKTAINRFPSRPTGFVVTGLRDRHEAQGYAYGYAYDYRYTPESDVPQPQPQSEPESAPR